jgi:hypothetical protein
MTKVFKNFDQLRELGFQKDEHDQWLAANCRVVVYQMDDTFQVFVTLRTGGEIRFSVRTDDTLLEAASEKADKAAERRTNKPQQML